MLAGVRRIPQHRAQADDFAMKLLTKRGTKREPQMGEFEALDSSDRADQPAERRRAEALSPESPLGNPPKIGTPGETQPEMGWRHPVRGFMVSA
jgi:hypothetical protein